MIYVVKAGLPNSPLGSELGRLTTLLRRLASLLRRVANLLTPPSRPPFKHGELEELLRHLAYEQLMFDHCHTEWKKGRERVVLESLLLHARNLRDFLFGRIEEYGRDADKAVIATDYTPSWDAGKGNHAYQVLWDTDQAINAQVAHISRRRAEPHAQRKLDYDAESIAAAVAKAWASFRAALNSTPWGHQFDDAIAAKRTELGLT